ncbi:hypothetical protein ZOSMA_5G02970 [Zostera marina]|uniref:DUF4228 domain-containing protein n=1 Tax=Zostera marina TaxID=29655 RepID=A0A0K9NUG8_ZOSMR|nr:hypothetical protein ZOSMA_5G02970 [Zostera marina]
MGIKSLRLQMLASCFRVMGLGNDEMTTNKGSVNLIRWDGKVEVYDRAVEVSEITKEFPNYLVCHSESFCIGQKVPALSDKDKLHMGETYFVLPSHFFQSVLSFVNIATSFSSSADKKCAMLPMISMFDIHKSPTGSLQMRFSDDSIQKLVDGEREEEEEGEANHSRSKLCTSLALKKEYKQLVRLRSLQWKPKLDRITETSENPIAPLRFRFAHMIQFLLDI